MINILIEQTRTEKMKHWGVKKFVPVFERMEEQEVYKYPTGLNFEKILKEFPRYERGEYNWWQLSKTSIPKKVWPISRIKRRRIGQLELGLSTKAVDKQRII